LSDGKVREEMTEVTSNPVMAEIVDIVLDAEARN
jgi:hypothetical protein